MDNKILAILLNKYQRMLESAIQGAREDLPPDMGYKSKNFFNQNITIYPILDKFETLDSIIKEDIELLKENE